MILQSYRFCSFIYGNTSCFLASFSLSDKVKLKVKFAAGSTWKYFKIGNVIFKDTLNTFYLQLYGVSHMVKDHSDSERGNPLLTIHEQIFLINSKSSFICTIPQTG